MEKKYVLEIESNENGFKIGSKCTGFESHELLGILVMKVLDVYAQMRGNEKPIMIDRKFYNAVTEGEQ